MISATGGQAAYLPGAVRPGGFSSRTVMSSLGAGHAGSLLVPGFYAFAPAKVDASRDFKRTLRSNHKSKILVGGNRQFDVTTWASDGGHAAHRVDHAAGTARRHAPRRAAVKTFAYAAPPAWREETG